jgi:hypothetical protein
MSPSMRGFPGYTIAGPKTIVRSLASLLKQWNLEYPSNVCCILALFVTFRHLGRHIFCERHVLF